MLHGSDVDHLLYEYHTVLILRLTLDQHGRLYRGVMIDRHEQIVGQFRDWQELVALLQQYWPAQNDD